MNKQLTYALLVFVAGSSYGFIVPVVKIAAANGVGVNDFLPLQYLVAFAIMLAVLLIRRPALGRPRELAKTMVLGLFTAGCSLCYYHAVALLPGAVALTMLFQFVWIGALIDCLVGRHLPSRSTVIAIAIVLLGTFCAAGVFDARIAQLDPTGLAAGLGSAVFYSLFLFFSGRVGTDLALPVRSIMLSTGGFITTSLASPAVFATAFFDAAVWPYAVLMSIIGVILPTCLIAYASPKLEPGVVSIMAASELPVGVLAAWAIIGDVPTPLTLVGVVLVLVGIAANQLPLLKEMMGARRAGR